MPKQQVSNVTLIAAVGAVLLTVGYWHYSKSRQKVGLKSSKDGYGSKEEETETIQNTNQSLLIAFQEMAKTVSSSNNLQQGDKLLLYGLYKQATCGNVDQSINATPSKLNIVAYAKHQSWKKFKGIPQDIAKLQYIEVGRQLLNADNDDIVYENDNGEEDDSDDEVYESSVEDFGGRRPSVMMAIPVDSLDSHTDHKCEILQAAMENDSNKIQELLKNIVNVDDLNISDEAGQTALHFLADRGSIESIKSMIEAGANVNICDDDGISVLSVAATVERVDVCQILLEAGADPDKPDVDGDTARSISIRSGNEDLLLLLK